eukprot:1479684-Rhodomonas_salina.1
MGAVWYQGRKDYCWRNYLSANTLDMMADMRKQFVELLQSAGLWWVGSGAGFGLGQCPCFRMQLGRLRRQRCCFCSQNCRLCAHCCRIWNPTLPLIAIDSAVRCADAATISDPQTTLRSRATCQQPHASQGIFLRTRCASPGTALASPTRSLCTIPYELGTRYAARGTDTGYAATQAVMAAGMFPNVATARYAPLSAYAVSGTELYGTSCYQPTRLLRGVRPGKREAKWHTIEVCAVSAYAYLPRIIFLRLSA